MKVFPPLVNDDVRPVELSCSADASKRASQKTGRFVSFQEPGGTAQFSLLHRSSHFGTGGFCSRTFWHKNFPRNQISVPCGTSILQNCPNERQFISLLLATLTRQSIWALKGQRRICRIWNLQSDWSWSCADDSQSLWFDSWGVMLETVSKHLLSAVVVF